MSVPENLLYTKEHEWLRVEGDVGVVGITHFAQEQLGDVVFVELPAADSKLTKGGSFGVVESVKTVSDLYSPVNGSVAEVNLGLDAAPEQVNTDPYGEGWIVKIKIDDPDALKELLSPEQYNELLKEE
jgi:glycine cleavage system H protein